ncbi:MAG: hypothetical protein IJU65_02375 [Desulfovibrio sp.]|nr:hypothetical protein [Desulfovibrio sp.]
MDMESLLMGIVNANLAKKAVASAQTEREDRSMPNSTRRAFESRMKADAAVARMASQNMEDAKAMVNVAQTGTTAIKSQLQAIQEILTDCAYTDGLTSEHLAGASASISNHIDEIVRLAQNTAFNGMTLMDGQHSSVQLQAGNSVRVQNFMNLLDTGLAAGTVLGANSMNLNNLATDLLGSGLALTSQGDARTALNKISDYIARMQNLESQYSYDYKSLDNLGILFEEQADIFDNAQKHKAATSAGSTSDSNYLQQILASLGNASILSSST